MTDRVAYLVSRYPAVSHTFVLREVEALRAAGIGVDTFSVRAGTALSEADRRELASTTTLLPPSLPALAGAAATALRHPAATWSTLRYALSRATHPKAALWQVFYVVEALLLFRQLRRRRIRHVHAHFANVGADVARLCTRLGRAITGERWTWSFTMHGPTEFANVDRYDLAGKAGDAELVVCISDYSRSQLQGLTEEDRWDRFHVVHCGIDPSHFVPEARRADPGPVDVLCVGRLVPEKGQAVLLEALRLLDERGVDAHVTFVGDGPRRQALEAIAERSGLGDRTTFTGAVSQDEIRAWYGKADVFCLPSFAEGVPVVLMEAMACGIPVVTTRITGVPELVEDGVAGLLVAPGRADLLADAVAELAADPGRRARMGEAGRAAVTAGFDISRSGEQLAGLFARLPR